MSKVKQEFITGEAYDEVWKCLWTFVLRIAACNSTIMIYTVFATRMTIGHHLSVDTQKSKSRLASMRWKRESVFRLFVVGSHGNVWENISRPVPVPWTINQILHI